MIQSSLYLLIISNQKPFATPLKKHFNIIAEGRGSLGLLTRIINADDAAGNPFGEYIKAAEA